MAHSTAEYGQVRQHAKYAQQCAYHIDRWAVNVSPTPNNAWVYSNTAEPRISQYDDGILETKKQPQPSTEIHHEIAKRSRTGKKEVSRTQGGHVILAIIG